MEIVKAYDVRGVVGESLTVDVVRALGTGFAQLVGGEGATGIVIGHDMRDSSPAFANALAEGATQQGLDVVLIGLASTDMLYFASGHLRMPGVMITASHNPAQYNGLKFSRALAAPIGQETGLTEIERAAEGVLSGDILPATARGVGAKGQVREENVLTAYAEYLRSLVDITEIAPLRICVDAGNGMAGYTAPAVFDGTPHTVIPLYFELDGTFPNHEANPLNPDNLRDLQAAVTKHNADIGLAFDGDADRCFVVDERGEAVSPSAVTALVAERELTKHPGATIIHNAITSKAVPELVTESGGTPVRTRVGHSFIKQEMATTGAVFGGEHSAHYYFREFWGADTGMLAALHVLAALGQQGEPLSAMMQRYERYVASGEINSTVADQSATMEFIKERASGVEGVSVDELDGLTIDFPGGSWCNVRPSNTEPLLRLNVEAPTQERMVELRDEMLSLIRGTS